MKVHQIYQSEALATLREMQDNTIDCIITDPPYFKAVKEEWDNKWSKKIEFINWLELIVIEFKRILKSNGSMYIFCSNKMQAQVQVMIEKHFNILNNIVWDKGLHVAGRASTEALRSYFDTSERIIFCEHYGSDSYAKGESGYEKELDKAKGFIFEPIRNYLESERVRAGIKKEKINGYLGFKETPGAMASRHYFGKSQWYLPTEIHYKKMQELFNLDSVINEFLKKDYEFLKKDYEELKKDYEELRRPFKAIDLNKSLAVWKYKIVNSNKKNRHICEKPYELIKHIVETSTNEDAVILDAFAGSGVVGEVCKHLNRSFTGIELDYKWACIADDRIKAA